MFWKRSIVYFYGARFEQVREYFQVRHFRNHSFLEKSQASRGHVSHFVRPQQNLLRVSAIRYKVNHSVPLFPMRSSFDTNHHGELSPSIRFRHAQIHPRRACLSWLAIHSTVNESPLPLSVILVDVVMSRQESVITVVVMPHSAPCTLLDMYKRVEYLDTRSKISWIDRYIDRRSDWSKRKCYWWGSGRWKVNVTIWGNTTKNYE